MSISNIDWKSNYFETFFDIKIWFSWSPFKNDSKEFYLIQTISIITQYAQK